MNSNIANKVGRREFLLRCASTLTGAIAFGLTGIQVQQIIFGFGQHLVRLATIVFTRFGREAEADEETLDYTPCE